MFYNILLYGKRHIKININNVQVLFSLTPLAEISDPGSWLCRLKVQILEMKISSGASITA